MKWFCIGMVLLTTALPYALAYGYGYGDSRQEENSRKLSTLETQVQVLTNELKALKEEVKVLKAGSIITEADPDLLPMEASRTMLPGGRVRFTLKYMAKPAILGQLRVFWIDTEMYAPIQEYISNEVPNLPPDIYETSVETEASNTSHVSVTVGSYDFWYRLDIKNSMEGDVVQHITSLPEGQVTSIGDIVYEPGTNASLKLTGPLGEQSPDSPVQTDIQFFINPPGSDDILEKQGDKNVLEHFFYTEEKTFFDKRELHIAFNTSVIAYSGLVMVMFAETYGNDPVYRIEKYSLLPLRPSNQPGAFREGLLAVRDQFWLETNANGDRLEHCRPGELCRVFCQFFGNNPNQVVMLRTVNGITETKFTQSHEESEFFSYAMDTFYMTSDQNPVNYTCIGSNAGGQRVVDTYIVYLDDPPTFVENETTIEVSPEGDVNITCTATGSPLPDMNMTFLMPRRVDSEHSEGNFEVLYQTDDTISVSKVVNLQDFGPEVADAMDFSWFVYCTASNTGGENFRHLYLGHQGPMVSA